MKNNSRSSFRLKGVFFVLVIFLSITSFAQTSEKQQHQELNTALDGVFQFQMIGIRSNPAYDTSLLVQISNEQKQSERVTFYYKNNIRVEILSKDEVQNGVVFSPNDRVIYVNQ
jgi:preprotein translocase subunit SecG